MGTVTHIHRGRNATDHEKAKCFLKILQACGRYIEYAQDQGVYKGWENDGQTLVNLINKMVLDHEEAYSV